MLVVSKIRAMTELENVVELPFLTSHSNHDFLAFNVTITDSETKKKTTIAASNFEKLVAQLDTICPYGYYIGPIDCGDLDIQRTVIVAIDSYSFKFLDYVDKVELVKKRDCNIRLSGISIFNDLSVTGCVDHYKTIFGFNAWGETLAGDGTAWCSLLDMVSIVKNSGHSDGFYLPVIVPKCGVYTNDDQVYRVTCSDFEKAKSLVARVRTLKPNLLETLYPFKDEPII